LYLLSTRWKLPDAALAAFALLTKTVSALILALADQPYLLFLGQILRYVNMGMYISPACCS
jgi:hypothetical protein